MSDVDTIDDVELFYHSHPISLRQILGKLKQKGIAFGEPGTLLDPETLQEHDQDHFGGIQANDVLADLAGIGRGSKVLDLCCGLGGPARYPARHHGCCVTGLDLTDSRVEGARALTRMTGLDDRVGFVRGNALDLPFEAASFDVVIGQEAFCHIGDKRRLIFECARVLRRGGRLAFTDILATEATKPATHARLEREMTFHALGSRAGYEALMAEAGLQQDCFEDLGRVWEAILADRLAMYRGLKAQTIEAFGESHFRSWDAAYAFFVGCYSTGELTGGRFLARKLND